MLYKQSFAALIFFGSFIVGVSSSLVKNETVVGIPSSVNNSWEVDYEAIKDFLEVLCNSTTSVCSKVINSTSELSENSTVQIIINVSIINNSSKPRRLGDQCELNKDCHSVPYSKCSDETCSCKDNYIPVDGRCKGLIAEPCEEDSDCGVGGSTCRNQICRCKIGFNSPANNSLCFPVGEGLHKLCNNDQGCKTPFSECFNGTCSCRDNYAEHDGVCYGLPGAQCHLSKDCVSVSYSCKLGTCQVAIQERNGKHILSKPGVSLYIEVWGPNEQNVRDGMRTKETPNGVPLYLTGSDLSSVFWIIKGSSEWKSSGYTLDKTIPNIDLGIGNLTLYCRIRQNHDRHYGRLQPPYYDKCIVPVGEAVSVCGNFEVLVGK